MAINVNNLNISVILCDGHYLRNDKTNMIESHFRSILNLILKLISINFSADQTPTPTSLIRNCEEFGLFDDLKHVNPFEETFRQAIDCTPSQPSVLLSAQKSLEVIKSNDEDTLHTPNIFPRNTSIDDNHDNSPKNDAKSGTENQIEEVSISDKQPVVIPIVTNNDTPASITPMTISYGDDDKNDIDCTKAIDGSSAPKQSTTLDDVTKKAFRKICPKPAVVPVACHMINPIKEKIRESLLKLRTIRNDDSSTDAKVPVANYHIPSAVPSSDEPDVRDIPKEEIKRQVIVKRKYTFQDSANERNREAAKRYRHKQKMLHDALLHRNAQLEAENVALRKQLQHFRKTHENCSVSLCEM